MSSLRRTARSASVSAVVVLALYACRAPTQVTLEVRTDVPCADLKGVEITVGSGSIESRPASMSTRQCAEGLIGTIAVAPGDDTENLFVRVTAGVDVDVSDCTAEKRYRGCIVVRRSLYYRQGANQVVAVNLNAQCKGTSCDATTTCKSRNQCVPADSGDLTPVPELADAGMDALPNAPDASDASGPKECILPTDCPTLVTTPAACARTLCQNGACKYVAADKDGDLDPAANCTTAVPGRSVTELGRDCDDTDPNITGARARPCGTSPAGVDLGIPIPVQGECLLGTQFCLANGSVSVCSNARGPSPDRPLCDGKDHNCNGTSNDGCGCTDGATQACGAAVGICRKGTQTCNGGTWGACVGSTPPGPRDCASSSDNDCNGRPDTSECVCAPGSIRTCATGLGSPPCNVGSQTCRVIAGRIPQQTEWSACIAQPPPSWVPCNAGDNNCNGVDDRDELINTGRSWAYHGQVCANLYQCSIDKRGTRRLGLYDTGDTFIVRSTMPSEAIAALGFVSNQASTGENLVVSDSGRAVGPSSTESTCCPPGTCNTKLCDSITGACSYTSVPLVDF
jgi:hypothetical protein